MMIDEAMERLKNDAEEQIEFMKEVKEVINASKELRESWIKWESEHLSRMKKEFEEL